MADIKVSLTIELPGAKMVSKEECLKTTQVPVLKHGKPVYKKGKMLYELKEVEDPDKHDSYRLTGNLNKEKYSIVFNVRKQETITQVINISTEAYEYFLSNYSAIGSLNHWKRTLPHQRLMMHLEQIAKSLGGKVKKFYVFDD